MNPNIQTPLFMFCLAFTSSVLADYNPLVLKEMKKLNKRPIIKFCLQKPCRSDLNEIKFEADCIYICPRPCKCLRVSQHPCLCCQCTRNLPPRFMSEPSTSPRLPPPRSTPQLKTGTKLKPRISVLPINVPPQQQGKRLNPLKPACTCLPEQHIPCVCPPLRACKHLATTYRASTVPSVNGHQPPYCVCVKLQSNCQCITASTTQLAPVRTPHISECICPKKINCVCPQNQPNCPCPMQPQCSCSTHVKPTQVIPITGNSKTNQQQAPVDCVCPPPCVCPQNQPNCLCPMQPQCSCSRQSSKPSTIPQWSLYPCQPRPQKQCTCSPKSPTCPYPIQPPGNTYSTILQPGCSCMTVIPTTHSKKIITSASPESSMITTPSRTDQTTQFPSLFQTSLSVPITIISISSRMIASKTKSTFKSRLSSPYQIVTIPLSPPPASKPIETTNNVAVTSVVIIISQPSLSVIPTLLPSTLLPSALYSATTSFLPTQSSPLFSPPLSRPSIPLSTSSIRLTTQLSSALQLNPTIIQPATTVKTYPTTFHAIGSSYKPSTASSITLRTVISLYKPRLATSTSTSASKLPTSSQAIETSFKPPTTATSTRFQTTSQAVNVSYEPTTTSTVPTTSTRLPTTSQAVKVSYEPTTISTTPTPTTSTKLPTTSQAVKPSYEPTTSSTTPTTSTKLSTTSQAVKSSYEPTTTKTAPTTSTRLPTTSQAVKSSYEPTTSSTTTTKLPTTSQAVKPSYEPTASTTPTTSTRLPTTSQAVKPSYKATTITKPLTTSELVKPSYKARKTLSPAISSPLILSTDKPLFTSTLPRNESQTVTPTHRPSVTSILPTKSPLSPYPTKTPKTTTTTLSPCRNSRKCKYLRFDPKRSKHIRLLLKSPVNIFYRNWRLRLAKDHIAWPRQGKLRRK